GFLLSCKRDPVRAVSNATEWVYGELGERSAKAGRDAERKANAQAKRDERDRRQMDTAVATFGGMVSGMVAGGGMVTGGMATGGMVTGGMVTGGMVTGGMVTGPQVPAPAPAVSLGPGIESITIPMTPSMTPPAQDAPVAPSA
ncbi:hypothetical protein C0991_001738, partial [Blastosporella zonata]